MEDVNSLSRKNCEKTAPPSRSPATLEPVSVRNLNMRIGRSGAFDRSSIPMKASTRAAETASSPIVSVVAHPCWVARVIAYTRTIRPDVIDAAPGKSK
jgi:hypothetical protein